VQALLETRFASASAGSPEASLEVEEDARGAARASAAPGTRRSASIRRAGYKTHQLYLQHIVMGLG
jgi:hypothetical protein